MSENKHTLQELQQRQALPLNIKVRMTQSRIRGWVNEFGTDGVYVSFSGGKDSTVLLHLVREMYPDVPAVFVDTGLEYPEIREFVKTFDNVVWLKPKMNFKQVIEKYGYPMISKEVSECVYGARKYLTSVLEQESLDRQTRSTLTLTCGANCADLENLPNFLNRQIRQANVSGEESKLLKIIGGGREGYSENSLEHLPQIIKSIPDFGKAIDNFRVQRMLGILPLTCKATMENIPSTADKSMFSCERYQFFLDAPFEISQRCCNVMKKEPVARYHKETGRVPFTAMMASESRLRTQAWLKTGCNAFEAKKQISNPMAFWTEQDVLLYIYQNHLPICSVYGDIVKDNEIDGQLDWADLGLFDVGVPVLRTTGCNRTGCMFCGFGAHLDTRKGGTGRFVLMKQTHPKQYEYIMKPWDEGGLGYKEVIDWINENGNMDIKY